MTAPMGAPAPACPSCGHRMTPARDLNGVILDGDFWCPADGTHKFGWTPEPPDPPPAPDGLREQLAHHFLRRTLGEHYDEVMGHHAAQGIDPLRCNDSMCLRAAAEADALLPLVTAQRDAAAAEPAPTVRLPPPEPFAPERLLRDAGAACYQAGQAAERDAHYQATSRSCCPSVRCGPHDEDCAEPEDPYAQGRDDGANELRRAAADVLAQNWTAWPDLLHALQTVIGVRDLPTALEARDRQRTPPEDR